MDRGLFLLVVVEVIVLVLVGLGVFALLLDQYDRTMTKLAGEAGAAEQTEIAAILEAATPSGTPTPNATPTGRSTLVGATTPFRAVSPTPTLSRTPSLSPTPRPTRSGPVSVVCGVIDSPGNYRLATDLTSSGDCIVVKTSYATLDCANHSIRGTGFAGYGIAVRKYGLLNSQTPAYIEIKNCRVSNFKYGIWTDAGKNLVIHDNNSSNNYDDTDGSRYGIFLEWSKAAEFASIIRPIRFSSATRRFIKRSASTFAPLPTSKSKQHVVGQFRLGYQFHSHAKQRSVQEYCRR
jgi:hypothetical protein